MARHLSAKRYEYRGEMLSIPMIADLNNISPHRLRDFLKNGYALEDAVERAKIDPVHRYLVCRGEKHSLTGWANITGLPRGTITDRLRRGLPPELCIYEGKLTKKIISEYERRNAQSEDNPETEQEFVERRLPSVQHNGRIFKVRWCDRTSHSHSWRETFVERSELEEFMDTHYLSKVVVGW